MCITGATLGVGIAGNWDFKAINWRATGWIYLGAGIYINIGAKLTHSSIFCFRLASDYSHRGHTVGMYHGHYIERARFQGKPVDPTKFRTAQEMDWRYRYGQKIEDCRPARYHRRIIES